MLRINGTESARSRRSDEEAGRYEMIVKNNSVKSINISMTKVVPERLETPYSDVALVRNVLCVQEMPTGLVLELKRLR
jgi:hypothetical protein